MKVTVKFLNCYNFFLGWEGEGGGEWWEDTDDHFVGITLNLPIEVVDWTHFVATVGDMH